MTCNEIEKLLPAYGEDLLSHEERVIITRHLALCPRCTQALVDLKKAEKILKNLEEVEAPPFFEQRIMSRVREEAKQKQGFLWKFFYPLHIKVPIQVLATLLIAVLAFHVYRQGEPETKQIAPFPLPLTELGRGQVTATSPRTSALSSDVSPIRQAPASNHHDNDQGFFVPPSKKGGKEEGRVDSQVPIREEHPPAMKTSDTFMAVREKGVSPVSTETSSKAKDRSEKQHTDKARETFLPAMERKEIMADTVAVGESPKTMSAPSPSGMTAVADIKRSVYDLTIQVIDMDVAIREVEARLGQVKARIIEKKDDKERGFLRAEIAVPNVATLLDLLRAVGKVTLEASPPAIPDGNVTANIKIVHYP